MSGFIPKDFIQQLLSRVDIVPLVHSVLPLKKMGAHYKACCPFHQEKSPSFNVSESKQFYHCFGCGVSGNAIQFVMRFHHLDFVAAVEKLAVSHGLQVPRGQWSQAVDNHISSVYEIVEKAVLYYQSHLGDPLAQAYLKKRALSLDVIERFRLGFSLSAWDGLLKGLGRDEESRKYLSRAGLLIQKENKNGFYDRFRERLMFPIRDIRGRTIGFGGRVVGEGEPKYLNSPETELFHKGTELYGLYEARLVNASPSRLLIVEGYMDVIALAQHGFHEVVATLGTATTPQHIQVLLRYTSELIFCFDGDRAGQQASLRALKVIFPLMRENIHVKFLFLPEAEDPDTQIRQEGLERFKERLLTAKNLVEYFFETLSADFNLESMEGRAALVGAAKPWIQSVKADIFRHFLYQELARRCGLALADIERMMQPAASVAAPVTIEKSPLPSSLARHAIHLLLHYPALIQFLPESWQAYGDQAEDRLLIDLVVFLKNQVFASAQDVFESWPDKRQAEFLQSIASESCSLEEDILEAEFLEVMAKIRRSSVTREAAHLIAKAKLGQISELDRQRLHELSQLRRLMDAEGF